MNEQFYSPNHRWNNKIQAQLMDLSTNYIGGLCFEQNFLCFYPNIPLDGLNDFNSRLKLALCCKTEIYGVATTLSRPLVCRCTRITPKNENFICSIPQFRLKLHGRW